MDSWPNQEALNKALNIYRVSMRAFIIFHLKKIPGMNVEDVVIDSVGDWRADEIDRILSESDRDIGSVIDINDFPHLVNKNWEEVFERTLNDDKTFRNQLWLIVECRNADWAHPPEGDADFESTRAHLFLIADVLGKINKSDAKDRVEVIRDELDDTAERLADAEECLKKIEAKNAEHKKSLAEVEKHLETAKLEKSKYAEDNATLSKQVDEKEKLRKKLSKQLKSARAETDKYKKNLSNTKKRLEKSEAAHTGYKERLETQSNELKDTKDELAVVEAERTADKKHLKTISKELKSVKAEWDASETRLAAASNQLTSVQAKKSASERYLAVTRNLLTTVGIRDQLVFPPLKTDSVVRILDRRGMNKRDYLLELLEQKQPTIIYVQSEEMVETLLDHIVPGKADFIEKHGEQTSEAEEMEILEKLDGGELIALVSDTTFSTLKLSHCVEHFVLCHLVPGVDEFYKRCEPVFASAKSAYLHLIYESKQDIEDIAKKYLDEPALRQLYEKFKDCTPTIGTSVNPEYLHSELCKKSELKHLAKLGIETGFSIFEELGFLKQNEEGIKRLSTPRRELKESEIYCRGEKLKKEIANSPAFQYEQSIEQIGKEIFKKLDVDSKEILRESNIHNKHFKNSEKDSDTQPTTETKQNRVIPPIPDVWPQRGMSAFNALRQQAVNTSDGLWVREDEYEVESTSRQLAVKSLNDANSVQLREDEYEVESTACFGHEDDYENKYGLAVQFAQEHGIKALEEGVAQLIKDRNDPDYNFTIDEMKMLRAFQEALKDSQTQPEQSTEVAVSQATKGKAPEKKPSIAERYTSETTEADRDELAVKIAKIRINATGSKPIAWHKIREKFGLKNDEFHKVIRLSAGYRKAVIDRIKQLKSRPEGWEYSGKLERLTGIELSESELKQTKRKAG